MSTVVYKRVERGGRDTHFNYATHCRPEDVHIHFFGADAFSLGERVRAEEGDVTEIGFPFFGVR